MGHHLEAHRAAQARGRAEIFAGYRLRVAHVLRDYSQSDRDQAPEDSRAVHALDGTSLNRRCGSMDNPSLTRGSDTETLRTLNDDYIQSVQRSDVRRFEELLAGDFQNSNPDGSLVDRAGFLAQIAAPATITSLKAEDVRIRVLGDFAIIHARTTYVTQGGRPAAGRYTDIWARREGRWLCIAAHVTRA
jgi:ketosteroid isomerase-like protein